MTIRLATATDAALLTGLAIITMKEAFGPPYNSAELVDEYIESAITQSILEAELADPRAVFFLLYSDEGNLAGYAKLRRQAPPRRMTERKAVEIQRLYLLQEQIGRGQGRMLMEYCLDWARSQGFAAVWLGVWEKNERAITFYERMGFQRFGYHYFQFGAERQRDFWLQKQLVP